MVTKTQHISAERDREATEQRLLDSVGALVAEDGFERIGVNAVAARAGVSKILIYRYFGSLNGLLAAYVRRHDFWINFPPELPSVEQLPAFLKTMFRGQIVRMRTDPTLRRLARWELSADNELVVALREQRERVGLELVRRASCVTGRPEAEVAAMASVLTASLTYLGMLEEFCPVFNGIRIDSDAGWEQMAVGVDRLIDNYFAALPQ